MQTTSLQRELQRLSDDIEVPNLGPIESFGDFPELDEDALWE